MGTLELIDWQNVIVVLSLILAIIYLARVFYVQFNPKSNTCSSCAGACSTIDFDKIAEDIISKKI